MAEDKPFVSGQPGGFPAEVTDMTWETSVERQNIPVVVMFYSPSCVFCHQMESYFRQYAGEFREFMVFLQINIVTNPWTTERYGVRSTPTFNFYCKGKQIGEIVGAVYPTLLKKTISEIILHDKECKNSPSEIDYEITGYG